MFPFDNTFAAELEGLFVRQNGDPVPDPKLVKLNTALARELGADPGALAEPAGVAVLAGSGVPDGAEPIAQAYAGHQFGGFSPQLGDGRALLLGEVVDTHGVRRDIALKGSGRTPFSRGGDGKAVLGPVLREYLVGEAMHALGIPTTRALAAVTTGEMILRDGPRAGAVLTRVASSHLRVGTFQFVAARGDRELLRRLADYTIRRHDPDLLESDAPYLGLLRRVVERQAQLVAMWMANGFVHGVMNTDNTTISGETIDYGPCAFVDAFDPAAVFSSIDEMGRYSYGNQPAIVQWNVTRLAESVLSLIDPADQENAIALATAEIERVPQVFEAHWLVAMRAKLGLERAEPDDLELANDLLAVMHERSTDFTLTFRELAHALRGDPRPIRARFRKDKTFDAWLARWTERVQAEGDAAASRAAAMDRVNPIYIPRNHNVERALQAADAGDFEPFESLLEVLENPYDPRDAWARYAEPAPDDFGPYTTFCGT